MSQFNRRLSTLPIGAWFRFPTGKKIYQITFSRNGIVQYMDSNRKIYETNGDRFVASSFS